MNKIIKRLEIIKSAIELEDEEIIQQQLVHLQRESGDPVITAIAQLSRRAASVMQCVKLLPGYKISAP